jgi:hypothetical protein
MRCYPKEGVIPAYSKTKIYIKCRSKIVEEDQVWVKNFALTHD